LRETLRRSASRLFPGLDRVAQCHEGNGTRDQTLCPSLGLHCDRTLHLEKKEEDWPLGAPLVSQAGARPVSLPPAPDLRAAVGDGKNVAQSSQASLCKIDHQIALEKKMQGGFVMGLTSN